MLAANGGRYPTGGRCRGRSSPKVVDVIVVVPHDGKAMAKGVEVAKPGRWS